MSWDKAKSVEYLQANAKPPYGVGLCATFVRRALEAGGLKVPQTGSGSAKDYGSRLIAVGFKAQLGNPIPYLIGDIAVIDGFMKSAAVGIRKDHLDGHVAMYDGTQWISDFKQAGASPYPGSDYIKAHPSYVIYRY